MSLTPSLLSLVASPVAQVPPARPAATLDELRFALRQCQRRLGTAAEEPTDFEHARDLAHAINNLLQREYLLAAVREVA